MSKTPEIMVVGGGMFSAAEGIIRLTFSDGTKIIKTETPAHGEILIEVFSQNQQATIGSVHQDKGPMVTDIFVSPDSVNSDSTPRSPLVFQG